MPVLISPGLVFPTQTAENHVQYEYNHFAETSSRLTQKGTPMSSLKGTRTEKNILTAFAGESQARNCGHLHHDPEAPEKCLACAHPRDHFELHGENW